MNSDLKTAVRFTLLIMIGIYLNGSFGGANIFAEEKKCKIVITSNPQLPIEPGKKIEIDISKMKNSLKNPNINDKTGWNFDSSDRGTVTLDDKVYHSKPYSVRIEKPVKPAYSEVNQALRWQPMTVYYAECYAKTKINNVAKRKGAKLYVSIAYGRKGEKRKVVRYTLQNIENTTDEWIKLAGIFRTPPDTGSGQVWGIFDRTGTAWFDDFFLCPLSATINYSVEYPDIKQVKLLNEDDEILTDSGILKKGTDNYKHQQTGLPLDEIFTVEVTGYDGRVFKKNYPEN